MSGGTYGQKFGKPFDNSQNHRQNIIVHVFLRNPVPESPVETRPAASDAARIAARGDRAIPAYESLPHLGSFRVSAEETIWLPLRAMRAIGDIDKQRPHNLFIFRRGG